MAKRSRYRVLHETRYGYSPMVTSSHQLAHLKPRATPWQRVLSHRFTTDPPAADLTEGADYFGNGVARFSIFTQHEAMIARAESIVEVESHLPPAARDTPPWEGALAAPGIGAGVDPRVEEYRIASPGAPVLQECLGYARPSFPARRPWLAALLDLTQRIRADFAYDPAATTVATRVSDVLQLRRGVCQDFAQLMVSCLRSIGLPARYVSGYVINRPAPGQAPIAGADASHAWAAGHCPGLGWVAFDPTNGKLADIEFITLGWGREFSDVTPLRGVVTGATSQQLTVAVSVEQL